MAHDIQSVQAGQHQAQNQHVRFKPLHQFDRLQSVTALANN